MCDDDVKIPSMNNHWSKASDAEIEQYRIGSHIHLKSIPVPSAVRCIDNTCTCEDHRRKIDQYFGNICEVLKKTSMSSIPKSKFKCSSEFIVPGNNEYVKELHDSARSSYLLWKRSGKLRRDVTECDMRTR